MTKAKPPPRFEAQQIFAWGRSVWIVRDRVMGDQVTRYGSIRIPYSLDRDLAERYAKRLNKAGLS